LEILIGEASILDLITFRFFCYFIVFLFLKALFDRTTFLNLLSLLLFNIINQIYRILIQKVNICTLEIISFNRLNFLENSLLRFKIFVFFFARKKAFGI